MGGKSSTATTKSVVAVLKKPSHCARVPPAQNQNQLKTSQGYGARSFLTCRCASPVVSALRALGKVTPKSTPTPKSGD